MKKTIIFDLFRAIIRIVMIFLAILVWTRYYESNLTKSVIFAAIGTLLVDFFLYHLHKRAQGKQALSNQQKQLCENIGLEFLLSSREKVLSYFEQLTLKTTPCTKQKEFIITKSTNFPVIIFPFYQTANFNFEHFLQVIQKTKDVKPKRVIVCTYQVSEEAKNISRNFSDYEVFLLNKSETFSLLIEPQKFYPEISPKTQSIKKTSIKTMLASIFQIKRAKTFAVCSIVLFLGSLILRHNLYYVITSSLLMTFAIISLLSPKFAKQKETNLFA